MSVDSKKVLLNKPELIIPLYEAATGLSATTHKVKHKTATYLVTCPAAMHLDAHPSCYLFADSNHWMCWTHPVRPKKGGILEMIAQAKVATRMPGSSETHRSLLWIEKVLGVVIPLADQPMPRARDGGKRLENRRIDAIYTYRDLDSIMRYQVVKFIGTVDGVVEKDFRFRRPDGKGRWIYHLGPHCGNTRCPCNFKNPGPLARIQPEIIPYRYRELRRAIEDGRLIIVCEGEKDADMLTSLGFVATSYPFGCEAHFHEFDTATHFGGAKRILIPQDADAAGRAAGLERAVILGDVATSMDLWPDRHNGFDPSDAVAGLSRPDARALIEQLLEPYR